MNPSPSATVESAPPPPAPAAPAAIPPVGAFVGRDGVTYHVWAPDHAEVRLLLGFNGQRSRTIKLRRDEDGYFHGHDPDGRAGDLYSYYLGGKSVHPDPASRFQPFGVFGPSMVVDPSAYIWKATTWQRPPLRGRVIYELHVGTFSPSGTYRGVIERLPHLLALGVNTIELMPLAAFAGRWNWGYDGTMLYAPASSYGTPDDLRDLVDAAHRCGLAVMLDVVYNHLGPTGNHLPAYASNYFHHERESPWGRSLNFDGDAARHVRAFFVNNAACWLSEFRIDGLRLDATHAIDDASPRHLIADIASLAHKHGAFVVAEDERNDAALIGENDAFSWNLDGLWADDFHHCVRVALTGQRESFFGSFAGTAVELAGLLTHGWLFRGQQFAHWNRPRGSDGGHLGPESFVTCISNHDQVGNRALGDRLNAVISPEAYRAASTLLCLSPYTPMLFMGQEWSASSPFLYFTDHPGELGENMARYRREEFSKYGTNANPVLLARMPDPQAPETFKSSVLPWDEIPREPHSTTLAFYRECLRLRAAHAIFQNPARDRWSVHVVAGTGLALRWRDPAGDWLLVIFLQSGGEVSLSNEPHLTATASRRWQTALSSNAREFGGGDSTGPLSVDALRLTFSGPGACLLREG